MLSKNRQKSLLRNRICYLVAALMLLAGFCYVVLKKKHLEPNNSEEVLVYARGGDAVSMDPAQETDGESLNVTDNIFESLLRFKPGTTEVEPWLAQSWEVSPNGLSYLFHLRHDVFFHDGTPFNADAVVFSWLRQHSKTHEAYTYARNWGYWPDMGLHRIVKTIEKEDADKVRVTLNEPHAPLLADLAMGFAAIVSPTAVRKWKQDFARHPVGTGPFVFDKWIRGERIILNANSHYWRKQASLKRLVFRNIPDPAARLNAFLAKEVHVMNLPTPDQLATITKWRKDAIIHKATGLNVGYLAFNTKKPPFDALLVRQAVRYVIDKQEIINGIYAGMGTAAVNPMPPLMWGYAQALRDPPLSLQKARELLNQAGFPHGFETELYVLPVARPYMPDGKKVGEVIQNQLAQVGIHIKLVTMEWGMYLNKTKNGDHAMVLMGWTGDNGDPDNFLHVLLSGENAKVPASNLSFYTNADVDDLLRRARTETHQHQRALLYQKIQEMIHHDVPLIPLAHSVVALPADARVQNLVIEPTGSMHFGDVSMLPSGSQPTHEDQ